MRLYGPTDAERDKDMFKRVLIANRGEIAVRAIRACKEMGIETVAIYSQADKESLHVRYADRAFCIGQGKVSGSYLYTYNIFAAAEAAGADAIYPGTGFFSENAVFAEMCEQYGIKFIGAESDRLRLLTSKIEAKRMAVEIGMPVARATQDEVTDAAQCIRAAEDIGYPVLIKAVDGGGGKGIRIVQTPDEITSAFESCREEAKRYFKSSKVFVEKFVADARHVEVQILADAHGHVIHLLDRDCTMQRRNQKLIEEGVCPFIKEETRQKMYADAIRLIRHIGYTGAATVEFLLDRDMNYYFMEVNPRVQVEHPVTEELTGADIVKEQFLIAAGEPLSLTEAPSGPKGHAIEIRVNAEDISSHFMCSTGTVKRCVFPRGGGIRVESHVSEGFRVTPFYDSLLAKIIVSAPTRELAIRRMEIALDETEIDGVKTNLELQRALLKTDEYISGTSTTHFVTDYINAWEAEQA